MSLYWRATWTNTNSWADTVRHTVKSYYVNSVCDSYKGIRTRTLPTWTALRRRRWTWPPKRSPEWQWKAETKNKYIFNLHWTRLIFTALISSNSPEFSKVCRNFQLIISNQSYQQSQVCKWLNIFKSSPYMNVDQCIVLNTAYDPN